MQIYCVFGYSALPAGAGDMGHFGVSFLEVLFFFLSNGLVTGCSVTKLHGHMSAATALFLFLPRSGRGVGKRYAVTSDFLLDCRSNFGETGPANKEDTLEYSSSWCSGSRHPTPRRWQRLLLLDSFESGVEGSELRNLFPRLGVE